MKKIICLLLTVCLLAALLTGCATDTGRSGKRSLVVTIFPVADWIWHVLGSQAENWEITVLLDNGADLHNYQPTAEDMVTIAGCDLFVCVGGLSDRWVDDALKNEGNPDRTVVRLLDELGSAAKVEELVEGMEPEAEAEEEEAPEIDEHIWLSLKNAEVLCGVLADKLSELDPEHAATYAASADSYIAQLRALDEQYAEMAASARHDTVVCADRFPFRYLMDDYNIKYYAAFAGCSAEVEASFETVVFLANKVDELDLQCVIQTETADGKLAHTVLDAAQSREQDVIFTLDSMQSGDFQYSAQRDIGLMLFYPDYLSIMESNLTTLRNALNAGE